MQPTTIPEIYAQNPIGTIIAIGILIGLYFIPWLLAFVRAHRNAGAIFVLNLFTGWTALGWVLALIWACTCNVKRYKEVN
jgi:hypothetical protein